MAGEGIVLNFDATNVPQNDVLEPLPAGWYRAAITESDMAPTASGNGSMLKLTLEVTEGPFKGRKLFDRLNLVNPNEIAVKIAYQTLSSIAHSTGVVQVGHSSALHGRPMDVKVALSPARVVGDKAYDASNEIKGYKPAGQAPAPAAAAAPLFGAPTTAAAPAFVPPVAAAAPAWAATPPPIAAPVVAVPAAAPVQAPVAAPVAAAPGIPPWQVPAG